MLTTLDKESQMLKVAVIQPPIRGKSSNKEITEFKLTMSQFSIVDKVDFFKQISELIYSNLIATSVSKDKLFKENKELQNKVKTQNAEKRALQIKKDQLEKKLLDQGKQVGDNNLTLLIQEKDTKISSLKKKLKILQEAYVQTYELKIVMEEKDSLQKQLIDSQANFVFCNNQKLLLEEQVKLLKEKIDQGSLANPSFVLASELGNLSVKHIELKKAQDELLLVRKQVQDKEALLKDATAKKTGLQDIISSFRQALIELRTTPWDNINREIKKVKEYLILLDEEKKLANLSLTNAKTMLESLGGKPAIAQAAINLLISQTSAQLQFARVENRSDLLYNAMKYIMKRETIKVVTEK